MSRPLRLHVPGALYHAFSRGNDKRSLFDDDKDYECFLELLEEALARFRITCLAYCLMFNHYHLLVRVEDFPISRMMQQLNSAYCKGFNRRHGRVGHVLQGRFGSRIVEDSGYARCVLRYLALNPVVAGCAPNAAAWPWSSFGATVGIRPAPAYLALQEVWASFDTADPAIGRQRFENFVAAGVEDLFLNPLVHGSETFTRGLEDALIPHRAESEFIYPHRFAARPPLSELFAGIHGRQNLQLAALVAYREHGYTLRQIGTVIRRSPSGVWRWIQRAALFESGQKRKIQDLTPRIIRG